MGRNLRLLIFLVYTIFGLYFLNLFFGFIVIPEIFSTLNNFIYLLSGILLILGGIFYLQAGRRYLDRR